MPVPIDSRLKLRDLRLFITVVQTGSMSKAAEILNTTQSAVSRSIAELEQTVGVRLLERNPHGIEPTDYGRALLDGGVAAIDDIRLALRSIESLADPASGEVRIGCTPALAESIVTAAIHKLSSHYPRIVFHIVSAYVETLLDALNDRKVDLLVARKVGGLVDAQLGYEFLFNDSYVVVAGERSRWVRRRGLTLAKLVKEPWTLPPPDSALGVLGMEAFRASGLAYPRIAVVTDSAGARTSLLATGHFLTIFPASVLKFPTQRPDLKALKVRLPIAPVPVGIFTLKKRSVSPGVRLFMDCSREVAKSLTATG